MGRRGIGARFGIVIGCAALLAGACGGGGGTSEPSPPPPVDPPCAAWSGLFEMGTGGGHSVIHSVAMIAECTFVISGYENSEHPGEPIGNARGFVRRIQVDAQGPRQQWQYLLETAGADAIYGADVASGAIYFWGATSGAIDGHVNQGKKDVVLGRLTLDGAPVKISQAGNEKPNVPLALLPASTPYHVLVGNDEVYVPTNFVESWEDPWIAQVTEYPDHFALDQLANRDTPGSDFHTAAAISGDSLITALRSEQAQDRGISLERRLISGDLVWSSRISEATFDNISAVRVVGDEVVVLGSTYVQLGDTALGGADHFLAGVDLETGEISWVKQFGTGADDWSRQLLINGAGFIVTGEVVEQQDTSYAAVYELDAAGRVTSRRSITLGTSVQALAAVRTGAGVMIGGSLRRGTGSSRGFLQVVENPA